MSDETWKERAVAAEARVAELERALRLKDQVIAEEMALQISHVGRLEKLKMEAVKDGVMLAATAEEVRRVERERDEARAKLALADRLAEAVRSMNVARSADTENVTEWVAGYQSAEAEIREAIAAWEAGEPVAQPDTAQLLRARLTCVLDAVKQNKSLHLIQTEVGYWATCEPEIIEQATREIDAAREGESDE